MIQISEHIIDQEEQQVKILKIKELKNGLNKKSN